ncbi:MAG: hypothetical protein AABX12_01930 [Nanoarchaeota archaeon]
MDLEQKIPSNLPSTGILPVNKNVVRDFMRITRGLQSRDIGRPIYEERKPVYLQSQEEKKY